MTSRPGDWNASVYDRVADPQALVVAVRSLRTGRVYYRLQMGTTSQAHSAVLCQRMRMIAKSCVVIGAGKGPKQGAR